MLFWSSVGMLPGTSPQRSPHPTRTRVTLRLLDSTLQDGPTNLTLIELGVLLAIWRLSISLRCFDPVKNYCMVPRRSGFLTWNQHEGRLSYSSGSCDFAVDTDCWNTGKHRWNKIRLIWTPENAYKWEICTYRPPPGHTSYLLQPEKRSTTQQRERQPIFDISKVRHESHFGWNCSLMHMQAPTSCSTCALPQSSALSWRRWQPPASPPRWTIPTLVLRLSTPSRQTSTPLTISSRSFTATNPLVQVPVTNTAAVIASAGTWGVLRTRLYALSWRCSLAKPIAAAPSNKDGTSWQKMDDEGYLEPVVIRMGLAREAATGSACEGDNDDIGRTYLRSCLSAERTLS
jgi:hypothetical protein